MPNTKLDPIDRKILAELQADGRMTNVELAKRVGISAPPCLRRVRTLEESGYIRGYHADVDPRELGFEVQVFAMVGLQSQAEVDLSAFEARCQGWPLVRECHMLNGEVDFILKCVAPDLSTFQTFLTEQLTAADISMDLAAHRVHRDGSEIKLGPTEFRLLRHFLEYPGRVFSREQLLDAVWGRDVYVEPRTVDVHIRRLRKALNADGKLDLIRTVRSAGYALEPEGA